MRKSSPDCWIFPTDRPIDRPTDLSRKNGWRFVRRFRRFATIVLLIIAIVCWYYSVVVAVVRVLWCLYFSVGLLNPYGNWCPRQIIRKEKIVTKCRKGQQKSCEQEKTQNDGYPNTETIWTSAELTKCFSWLDACHVQSVTYRCFFLFFSPIFVGFPQVQGGMRVIKGVDGVLADTASLSAATKAASASGRPSRCVCVYHIIRACKQIYCVCVCVFFRNAASR